MSKLKLSLLVGARTDEYVSCITIGQTVFDALDRDKYEVSTIRVLPDGLRWLFPKDKDVFLPRNLDEVSQEDYDTLTIGQAIDRLRADKVDIVFLATPGGLGEDGSLQGLMQAADLKYTSSGVMASSLAMDKWRTGQLYQFHGIKTPKTLCFQRKAWTQDQKHIIKEVLEKIGLPCFVKPSMNGSSIGAGPVKKPEELKEMLRNAFKYSKDIIVQELVVGKELTCAVIDDGENEPMALSPSEIIPLSGEFLTYEHKHVLENGADYVNPPNLPKEKIEEIRQNAVIAHKILGCTGLSRTDLLLDDKNELYVLETNTIPNLTTKLYPTVVARFGMTFPEFLDKIIQAGLNREVN